MRILFVSQYFPPEPGAPAARTYDNCKRWAARGHEVTVLTAFPNHPEGRLHPGYRMKFFAKETLDGIEVARSWIYLAPNKAVAKRCMNYLSFMVSAIVNGVRVGKKDIVVATSPQLLCGIAGYLISRLKRVRFVLEIRDLWPDSVVAVGAVNGGPLIRILEGVERWLYRKATGIVALTESFKAAIGNKLGSTAKIVVNTNGVDVSLFREREKNFELTPDIQDLKYKFIVSYVGTLGMAHSIETVLKAAQKLQSLPDVHFIFVGEGAQKSNLEKMSKRLNLRNVRFLGRKTWQETAQYYANSDLCLVTLKKAALFKTVIPSKLFEIMAMARPIILGVEGEAKRIVEASGAGVCVEPDNPDELAEAIRVLHGNPEELRQMGQKGAAFVREKYDRDILCRQYENHLLAFSSKNAFEDSSVSAGSLATASARSA